MGSGTRSGLSSNPAASVSRDPVRVLAWALLTLLVPAGAAGQDPGTVSSPEEAAGAITARRVHGHIAHLASDRLRGRATPSPGLDRAARYVAGRYRELGLEPAGEGRSFHQRYPVPGTAGGRAPNVIALLRGSDPELRRRYVVLSAHLDHLGTGSPVDGDSIYNGADDNASGTAALLEVARALSLLTESPRRSVLFLHVSGEEEGLVGSRWFVERPTVDLDAVVANLNADMIAGDRRPGALHVIEAGSPSLGSMVEEVSRRHPELGLTLSRGPMPARRGVLGSDHLSFAARGIPALWLFTGVHECYHRSCDEPDFVDAEKAARVARLLFHVALEIGNADPARFP